MKIVTQTIEERYLGNLKVIVSTLSEDGKAYSCHKDAYLILESGVSRQLKGKDRLEAIKKLKNLCDRVEISTETFNL